MQRTRAANILYQRGLLMDATILGHSVGCKIILPLLAHQDIIPARGIWSLLGHSGHRQTSYWPDRVANDPNVWSGRAVQEDLSIWLMRSCINVSGL